MSEATENFNESNLFFSKVVLNCTFFEFFIFSFGFFVLPFVYAFSFIVNINCIAKKVRGVKKFLLIFNLISLEHNLCDHNPCNILNIQKLCFRHRHSIFGGALHQFGAKLVASSAASSEARKIKFSNNKYPSSELVCRRSDCRETVKPTGRYSEGNRLQFGACSPSNPRRF